MRLTLGPMRFNHDGWAILPSEDAWQPLKAPWESQSSLATRSRNGIEVLDRCVDRRVVSARCLQSLTSKCEVSMEPQL